MVQVYEDHFDLRQRKRKASDQKILEETVEAILCDMMVVHLSGETRGSALPLSHSVLGTRSRYRPAAFTKQLPNILKALASSELDFIRMQVGWQKNFGDRGQRTLIWPGWRILKRIEEHSISLADIGRRPFREVIVLKASKQDHWDESQYLDYEDTPSIVAMRQQMIEINEWLEQADIDVPDIELAERLHLSDKSLRRVFTRGSFESGGRLFGGFWQYMKKDDRLYCLAINEEGVSGLDFGQIAIRIAYSLVGSEPPEGDLYDIAGHARFYRPGIKKLFNALLSSQQPINRKPRGTKGILPPVSLPTLIEQIGKKHPAIKPLFFTSACHKIQFIESQIMVEVILRLKQKNIVALPIHDGLVVASQEEDQTKQIMEEVAFQLTGIQIPVTIE